MSSRSNIIFYPRVDISKIVYKTFNAVGVRNKIFLTSPFFEFKSGYLSSLSKSNYGNTSVDIEGEFNFAGSGFTHGDQFVSDRRGVSFDADTDELFTNSRLIPGKVRNSVVQIIDLNTLGKNYNEMSDSLQRNYMRFTDSGESTDVILNEKFKNLISKRRFTHILSPFNFSNEIKQSFFFFDFSSGDFKLESGDVVENATINLKISSHFGERTISSGVVQGASSLFGPLRINPRVFQVIRIKKDFDRSLCNNEVENPEARFENGGNFFDTYYGTSGEDVDENVISEFTISEPMKKGDILKVDITKHLQDAIDNRSQKLRFAIRPKMKRYARDGSISADLRNLDPDQGGFGVGNHYFEFERGVREDEQPRISVNLRLKADSTGLRRARFQRTKKVQL